MAKRETLKQLRELAAIRRAQREHSRSEVHIAKRSKERAVEIQDSITDKRDEAVQDWEDCFAGVHFTPELTQNLASALLGKEQQLEQANEHVAFADQRLNSSEENWLLSELQYKLACNLGKEATKKYRKTVQEDKLSEAADRFGYRSVRHER